jgi:hypothetical protein
MSRLEVSRRSPCVAWPMLGNMHRLRTDMTLFDETHLDPADKSHLSQFHLPKSLSDQISLHSVSIITILDQNNLPGFASSLLLTRASKTLG